MVCASMRSTIPSLKLGDYFSVQRTNHALSLTKIHFRAFRVYINNLWISGNLNTDLEDSNKTIKIQKTRIRRA